MNDQQNKAARAKTITALRLRTVGMAFFLNRSHTSNDENRPVRSSSRMACVLQVPGG
jgi:hypothetical protein